MEIAFVGMERAGIVAGEGRGERARRVLNFVLAALAIVVTLPLMLLIALWVKASSPGPVLFTQMRVGLDRRVRPDRRHDFRPPNRAGCRREVDVGGCPIRIYKFRTMVVQEPGAEQVWAVPGDPRITPAGRFLRKCRLDELPQLFNVLRGEMNIVGPRPEQPAIFRELRDQLEHYPVRQRVLPGITGLAQVSHGYDQSLEDVSKKLHFDLEYIQARSPLTDLQIMARTIPVMFFRDGAL